MNTSVVAALTFRSPLNAIAGRTVERTVDASGLIMEEYTDADGKRVRQPGPTMDFRGIDDDGNEIPGAWDKIIDVTKGTGWTLVRRTIIVIEDLTSPTYNKSMN